MACAGFARDALLWVSRSFVCLNLWAMLAMKLSSSPALFVLEPASENPAAPFPPTLSPALRKDANIDDELGPLRPPPPAPVSSDLELPRIGDDCADSPL